MTADPDLHDKLGEVISLAQAMRLLARDITARLQSEDELDATDQLAQFMLEAEELQRRCDSFVASHGNLKQSRARPRPGRPERAPAG